MDQITATIAGTRVQLKQLDASYNCWGTKIGKAFLIQHGVVDSQEKVEKLCQDLEAFCQTPALRLSSLQLGLPESDWEQITAEHILFAWLAHEKGLSLQVAHMSVPTQPLYTDKGAPPKSEFLLKAVSKLPKLHNIDGWETYCYWLHEEMERLLEIFQLESMEVYTLQALLSDFIHEVRASLLQSLEVDVAEILMKEGVDRKLLTIPLKPNGDAMSLEKRLFRRRSEAKEEISAQYEILARMIEVIPSIEKNHPELKTLKSQTRILHRLLGTELDIPNVVPLGWVERVILLQLLNEDLGVVTSICYESGYERTSLSFALQAATLLMRQQHSLDLLIDMALHWKETLAEETSPRAQLIKQLKQLFVEVIEQLCIPLTAATTQVQDILWHDTQIESADFLELFPPRYLRPDKKGLNREGHRLLVGITPRA